MLINFEKKRTFIAGFTLYIEKRERWKLGQGNQFLQLSDSSGTGKNLPHLRLTKPSRVPVNLNR